MKRVTPNGSLIKELRERLEKGSLQEEMAHTVGVSERLLRSVKNKTLRSRSRPSTVSPLIWVLLARALRMRSTRLSWSLPPVALSTASLKTWVAARSFRASIKISLTRQGRRVGPPMTRDSRMI